MPEVIVPPVLHRDGRHDDSATIRHLLNGGVAYDVRMDAFIRAPTLRDLPDGVYRTVPLH